MKLYLVSIAAGVLVGLVYGLLNVRSPAPPIVALLGLLGILVGEQIAATVRRGMSGRPITMTWIKNECVAPILGHPAGAMPIERRRGEPEQGKNV